MKVDTIRDKIIEAKYDSSDIDGSDYVARLAKELKDVLVRKEGKIVREREKLFVYVFKNPNFTKFFNVF